MSALRERQREIPLEPRRLRRVLVGRPMRTHEAEDELLPIPLALPIFAADAISSVAYATEAAMVVLLAAGLSALHVALPISVAVAALMAIVVTSYRQTVRAYEVSGGAYVVARENLGTLPSLVAAAALLVDYVLTVAVSVASGVLAITSAVPSLNSYNTELSLLAVVLITVVNLRGVRESGLAFALPTYLFIVSMLVMVGVGVTRCATSACTIAHTPNPLPAGVGTLTLFLVLKAFASGASALTGVEAIANGVNAFKHPQAKNASRTLGVLGVVAITMFLGVSYLAVHLHARPSSTDSVVSQVARAVFPAGSLGGWMYWVVQVFTFAVLILAANTSFQGFPRLSALLAHDRFIARQFENLGDRLVYSNGVGVLAGAACLLIWIYHANVNNLIHLYVVGVFTAFTLSQAGMVRYWQRRHGPGWKWRALINGTGAIATFVVMVVVVITKFTEGAWLVIIAVPTMVAGFYGVRRHYRRVARRLEAGAAAVVAAPPARNTTLLLVESLDEASDKALSFARRISPDGLRAVHVPTSATDPGIRPRWFARSGGAPLLEQLDGSDGVSEAVLEQVWRLPRGESDFVTVVVPELFSNNSLFAQASRPREFALKLRLLTEPGLVVADVPAVRGEEEATSPKRLVARVLVSGINAASMRAVNYATTLGVDDTRAVHFAFSADDASVLRSEWRSQGPRIPLEVDDAPYRDLGAPLLRYLRTLTADGETEVLVIMPELVTRGWRRLLHNQRALYLKRLLLFEPDVVLASVPYQLLR
ncbi:MAG: APC family permease [Actinobacteria bacterium]|nr:APC family permease [Actinomycetota bacterium]MBV8562609.1 APC family permease [Actinomycetota bacterium]